MYKENDQIVYSPSDITTYMSSPFAAWMNRWKIECPDEVPQVDGEDEFNTLLSHKGIDHEDNLLVKFKDQGLKVASITDDEVGKNASFEQKKLATIEAMRAGFDVIFQATLELLPFRGYADFLIKVPGDSELGNYHYEVWDTKLASKVKPYFVVQLCCYAEMLEHLQGIKPKRIVVALGNGTNKELSTEDYFYYYLSLKEQFLASQNSFDITSMIDPADSKSYGHWSSYAEQTLAERDHLSLIANISRSQIKKLNYAGITTCTELAQFKEDRVSGVNQMILDRLKSQAIIQLESNGQIPPLFNVLDHDSHKKKGLTLLPPHSDLDVFFDIEGYPLDEGGLEYLWGNTYFDDNGNRQFIDFWAHDAEQEKQAFSDFIQWVYERWKKDPKMHIYHYASYEITACRKLMSRYGICEYEVDQLLRNDVFVDLYKVVKGGILVGEPRYSIKNVEHLYRGKRDTEVGDGGASVVVYEQWRENFLNGEDTDDWKTSKVLNDIREYNIDDCDSTQELVDWLRNQQHLSKIEYIDNGEIKDPEVPEEVNDRTKLRDRLLLRSESEEGAQSKLTQNLAWTLEFHRREAKPVFWRLFDRIGLDHEELVDDIDCLSGCIRTEREPFKRTPRARNLAYEFKFDINQEFKANAKSYYIVGEEDENGKNIKATFLKEESDLVNGLIVLTSSKELPSQVALVPDEYVNPSTIQLAIDDVVSKYEKNKLGKSAIIDFLNRNTPRITGREVNDKKPIVESLDSNERMKETISAVLNLDHSYLTIQGPPGTGKTYTGKHIIAELVKRGMRVGISSNSHKAINNLLIGVAEQCKDENISVECFCTRDTGEEIDQNNIQVTKNSELSDVIQGSCVIGTTAWGFCRDDMEGELDYLFIDEAGQVSVANLIGMSRSARNIVLMGDQMQLGQPSQGTHPLDSGLSILDYLLHENPTIPDNMGVFLGTTYRMHSAVNDFISHAIYEGKLKSDTDNDIQKIAIPENYKGPLSSEAGVIIYPVEHEGNTQASDEEVNAVKELSSQLIGRIFTDKEGINREIDWNDILFVAPYNHQVNKLRLALGEQARVGSVDKFQGQEAPIVFLSMCTSDANDSLRGIDFLFDRHRINVAISRAQALAIVVSNPKLREQNVNSLSQLNKINTYCRLTMQSST